MAAPADVPNVEGIEELVVVGRGGFATVYRGRQPAFQRDVAVKVLQRSGLDTDDRRRFERECQAMGALSDHPGIVTLYDAGFTSDERPYLVMAFAPGGTLADQLRSGPLPWQSVTELGVRLAGALETAHRVGVIHRDIKPANVLRSDFGVQLSDFGIARLQGGHETQSGLITASVAHAAPEILDGERPSVQADVYSLGSTLYEAVVGEAAFVRRSDEGLLPLMRRVVSDPVPDLRHRGVPEELAAVIQRAMEKAASERYESAEAMGRALQETQTRLGISRTDLVIVGEEPAGPSHVATTAMAPVASVSDRHPPPPQPGRSTDTAELPGRQVPATVPPDRTEGTGVLKWAIPVVFLAVGALIVGLFLLTRDGGNDETADVPGGDSAANPDATAAPPATDTPPATPERNAVVDTAPQRTTVLVTTPAGEPAPNVPALPDGPLELTVVSSIEVPADADIDGFAFTAIDAVSYDVATGHILAVKDPAADESDIAAQGPALFSIPIAENPGDGVAFDIPSASGAPLTRNDGNPYGPQVDVEGMAVFDDGTVFVVSEGTTDNGNEVPGFVHRFDGGGRFVSELRPPPWYLPNAAGTQGLTPNRGLHGIDRRPGAPGEVVVATEFPLLQDHDPAAPGEQKVARLVAIDVASGAAVAEWGYPLDPTPPDITEQNPNLQSLIVDITTLADDSLVVLETTRSEAGPDFVLYRVRLGEGSAPSDAAPPVVEKTPISVSNDPSSETLSPYRSVAAGPVLADGRASLILASDSEFTDGSTRLLVLAVG